MSYLLYVTRWASDAITKGREPLYIEFPVHPETAPYMVTSLNGVRWMDRHSMTDTPKPEPVVRAMVRDATPDEVFAQVVGEVLREGQKRKWGNVHPLTEEGLTQAQEYLEFYDLGETDILAPTDPKDPARQFLRKLERPYQPCAWLPAGTIVVVPKDRSLVGVIGMFTPKKLAGVIHNAARSISILTTVTPKRKGRRTGNGPGVGGPDREDRSGEGLEQGVEPGGLLPAP